MSFAYNDALDDNTTAATEPSSDTGTAVLERPKAQERRADDGDADRFAHYVSRDRIAESRLTGARWWHCAARCGCRSATRRTTRSARSASAYTRR